MDLKIRLGVVATESTARLVTAGVQGNDSVAQVSTFETADQAAGALARNDIQGILIDVFRINGSFDLVRSVRARQDDVAICLIGSSSELLEMPNVPIDLVDRFSSHYNKLPIDLPPDDFLRAASAAASQMHAWWLRAAARRQIARLQSNLENAQSSEVARVLKFATVALSADEQPVVSWNSPMPEVHADELERLVTDTLNDAQKSLNRTAWTNIGVVASGVVLLFAAFLASLGTKGWTPIVFGAMGTGGIVAALVSSPLKRIGLEARRLIQVQAAYMGFLNQMLYLNNSPSKDLETALRKCDQVDKSVRSLQETLSAHFG
jgi:hypothetical protein